MSTFRVVKRDRYTSIARGTINDDRLSFRARGVLVWLLDKPDDWSATRESIAAASTDGVTAVRSALRELASFGYLVRTKVRLPDGRMVTETMIHEVPPEAGNRPAGNRPAVVQPAIDQELKPNTETETASVAGATDKVARRNYSEAADQLARAEWERRTEKPVCGFPALRARISEALDAGHSVRAVARVLPTMPAFSRNAFDFALRGKATPRTADRAMTEDPHYWDDPTPAPETDQSYWEET